MSSLVMGKGFSGFVALDPGRTRVEQKTGSGGIQIERIRESARREAEDEFKRQLNTEREHIAATWRAAETALREFMGDFEKRAVNQVIEMAVRIAEIIIRSKLPDRQMLVDTIREILSPMMDLQGVRIRLSTGDADLLKGCVADCIPAGGAKVDLAADEGLSAGDVVVESRNGYFNAKLPERMKLLESQLRERWGHVTAYNKQP